MFRSLTNPQEQIQRTQHRILLATQQMLWMWLGSFMVPNPFWIQICVHGFKTHLSSTSDGLQLIYNQAPEATGGRLAAGHHPGFLLGLRTRTPRPRGLVVEW